VISILPMASKPAKSLFTRKTFQYYDEAKRNNRNAKWFPKNKENFEASVRAPFLALLEELNFRIGHRVPSIPMGPRKISRPLRAGKRAAKNGLVRASTYFYLAVPSTSRFESNPGLFMQLGDEKEDNVIGVGLYMPSSRQIRRLRAALQEDHASIRRILADRKLKKYWGELAEEKYKRFPKDLNPEHPAADLLMYKQFHFTRHFTRKEVTAKDFPDTVMRAFEAALPFLGWLRENIGVYDRKEWERQRADELARAEEQMVGW
jgi:uncharacterized protein (TIGR02453 family)